MPATGERELTKPSLEPDPDPRALAAAAGSATAISQGGPERVAPAIESMFDAIAQRYDLVNTLTSFGADGRWRKRTVRCLQISARDLVLDVACGSGRLAAALSRAGPALVSGLDFSSAMLAICGNYAPAVARVRGDALALPYGDGSFSACTIAFGLRNLPDPARALAEMSRILTPGGRLAILEFLRPGQGPWGRLYRWYLRAILPKVGGLLTGNATAYSYLQSTIDSYLTLPQLSRLLTEAGFERPNSKALTMGTVGLLVARKPAS